MTSRARSFSYENSRAVLATMHAKERVIAPILREVLGIAVVAPNGLDTDRFGAFSGEIERIGTPLEAARAKIAAGFAAMPAAQIGIASEGSFGPHPHVPFIALGRELVAMIDRESGLELIGFDASHDTNFAHLFVKSSAEAVAFAGRVGFPEHGVIVLGAREERPAPDLFVQKSLSDLQTPNAAVEAAINLCGVALVETDMRAYRNPTRMAAIGRATRDLVRLFESRCPSCTVPGFDVAERVPGLPCAWCGEPTQLTVREILRCKACGHEMTRPATSEQTANPGLCDGCNP